MLPAVPPYCLANQAPKLSNANCRDRAAEIRESPPSFLTSGTSHQHVEGSVISIIGSTSDEEIGSAIETSLQDIDDGEESDVTVPVVRH